MWGLKDYWVGVLVAGDKHMLVIQAMNENEAEQEAIYFCELAKGF
jgi:hypothetical protein